MPIQDGKPMPIQGEDADKGPRPHYANAKPAYPDMKANYNSEERNGPHFSSDVITEQNRAFTQLACNSTTHVVDGTQVLFKKSTES